MKEEIFLISESITDLSEGLEVCSYTQIQTSLDYCKTRHSEFFHEFP